MYVHVYIVCGFQPHSMHVENYIKLICHWSMGDCGKQDAQHYLKQKGGSWAMALYKE